MKDIPNKIYLQVDPENEKPEYFSESGTTWCSDRIYDNDIPYYRKQVSVEPEVIVQEGDLKLLTLLMADTNARISTSTRWMVRDDNLWFVYEQQYGKRVKKLLETDKFVKALALLSK